MNAAERIMVALDAPDADQARRLLDSLKGVPCWFKVGMELFYAVGPGFVEQLKANGHRVFVDLKLHDIPNTVKGASASLTRLGADMFNVHASGGLRMMEAAREGVEGALAAGGTRPLLIGVTVLTSTDRRTLNEEIGVDGTVERQVLHLAGLTRKAGLDGVVCSAHEVPRMKEANGAGFIAVTPGIRPAGVAAGDQSRVMTPAEAIAAGSDYLVIGRAVTAASDPRQALESIIKELESNE